MMKKVLTGFIAFLVGMSGAYAGEVQTFEDAKAAMGITMLIDSRALFAPPPPAGAVGWMQGRIDRRYDDGSILLKFNYGDIVYATVSASSAKQLYGTDLRPGRDVDVIAKHVGNKEYKTIGGHQRIMGVYAASYIAPLDSIAPPTTAELNEKRITLCNSEVDSENGSGTSCWKVALIDLKSNVKSIDQGHRNFRIRMNSGETIYATTSLRPLLQHIIIDIELRK